MPSMVKDRITPVSERRGSHLISFSSDTNDSVSAATTFHIIKYVLSFRLVTTSVL
jgi:hypothetical protein